MNKKKLVIASVLKPVNDSRNYEKTAISINKFGNYEVYLVGQRVWELPMGSPVLFNPLFSFQRLSPKRLLAGWIFFRYLCRLRPEVVIITTFELLKPAVFYKLFLGGKLLYDVQENYYRNLVYTNSFPPVLKNILAVAVRLWEYATRPFVNHYLLAEKNYEKEFSFTRNKSTILENKIPRSFVLPRQERGDGTILLLYTGTIAENYGIFEAIALAKLLHQREPRIRLAIAGFAAQKEVLEKVKEAITGFAFISLTGGSDIVPHRQILQLIASADLGLISYRPDKSTENCIPTKLYEYLAHRLPYLVGSNPVWRELTQKYQAGIEIDFTNPDAEKILEALKENKFYPNLPGEEIYWEENVLEKVVR